MSSLSASHKAACDHEGVEFDSLHAMCRHWGVPVSTYCLRMANGWTQSDALTTPGDSSRRHYDVPITDHLGNEYPDQGAMCAHWGVIPATFYGRLSRGWSVGEALLGKASRGRVVDHLGNEYPSIAAMCRHWGVKTGTYCSRRDRGWDLRASLTGDRESVPCLKPYRVPRRDAASCAVVDHTGRLHADVDAMCLYWNADPVAFRWNRGKGLSVGEALAEARRRERAS